MSVSHALRSVVAPIGNLGGLIFPIGCLALLVVPGIWFYQGREYLNSGTWPPVTVADGLHWAGYAVPHAAMTGSLVTERFLAFPLSLVLLVLIGGPLIVYARFSQWLEKTCEPDITPLN
ncbi:MAG TPA: hypothetical protein VIL42_09880 [Sphingomicrobium sp.]|jgi:hypothetical protein